MSIEQREDDTIAARAARDADDLDLLEARLGVRFDNRALLLRAVTHHSACPATAQRDGYDTLEFLGDALLGALVVEHLFHRFPEDDEGALTALKSEVVSRRVLAPIGQRLGLERHIRVDIGSLRTYNERTCESLCADVVEALIAAIHLDQGRDAAAAFVAREVFPAVDEVRASAGQSNPRGVLQQRLLRDLGVLPRYETLRQDGQSNDRRFTVGVFACDRLLAQGTGSSIKAASREAARAALERLATE